MPEPSSAWTLSLELDPRFELPLSGTAGGAASVAPEVKAPAKTGTATKPAKSTEQPN